MLVYQILPDLWGSRSEFAKKYIYFITLEAIIFITDKKEPTNTKRAGKD